MQGKNRIEFANTLRGFAALAVVISHYFGVFWLNRPGVGAFINAPELSAETHATPVYVSVLNSVSLFNWGGYGVALFFLISGFVIPLSLQKMNWWGFLVNRTLRIVPTYVVGFSITLLGLYVSSQYFGRSWPYNAQEIIIHYVPGIRDILWSRSIDGIIWTLEIEMKFYVLCALAILWFRKFSAKVFVIPVILFLVAVYCHYRLPAWSTTTVSGWRLGTTFIASSQFIIFMFIGVVFQYLYRGKLTANKAYLLIAGLFVLFCIQWRFGLYSGSFSIAWSYGFALLTFTFAYYFPRFFKSNPVFDFLADISYPLYIIHGISGYVALRILLANGFRTWASLLAVTLGILLLSWLLHRAVERPSQRLGKSLSVRLMGDSLRTDAA